MMPAVWFVGVDVDRGTGRQDSHLPRSEDLSPRLLSRLKTLIRPNRRRGVVFDAAVSSLEADRRMP